MKRTDIYSLGLISTLATTLFFGGCSSDKEPGGGSEFEEGIPTEIGISISSHFNAMGTSRADGTPADPEDDNEKINDWFIVFADTKTNTVQKVITRSGAGIATKNNPVEAETFRFVIPSGHYNVYAFANISETELNTVEGLSFTVGSGMSSDIEAKEWGSELNNWDISKSIPMTGFLKNIEVKNTIEENFSIEVVRMVAKVEFRFSNPTDTDITITGVSFDPVTSSAVSLFPRNSKGIDYGHLGNGAYSPLAGASYAPLSITTQNWVVETGEENKPYSFYMKETISKMENDKAFTVGIKVRHGDGTAEQQQYNITKDIKDYINRNDWIVIPIMLSQYDVSAEAIFYPPIGGYPAVLSTTDPDGSQVFTFGTEGKFAIVPHVIDKMTGSHLAPIKYTISLGTIKDEDGIFSSAPIVTPTSTSLQDEITGTLSTAKGKATVELSVIIGTQTYTRTIYIIRN